jgi:NADH-quinone oxidoreductase subunit J
MGSELLYTMCVIGAAALYVLLRPGPKWLRGVGVVVGLGVVGWLLGQLAEGLGQVTGDRPTALFYVFAAISVIAAIRMITHTRPVYAALHFIFVIISSAALFLLLHAEFLAFALIIVYAGAILITYLFVLMLARQAPAHELSKIPMYDRVPREPAAAAVVGFVLLALFSGMIYEGTHTLPDPPGSQQAMASVWADLDRMPRQLQEVVDEINPEADVARNDDGQAVFYEDGQAFVRVTLPEQTQPTRLELPAEVAPGNIQRVGLSLVADFPASLELAGVILLMAMFGAVVMARRQFEIGEDVLRQAAGMAQYSFEEYETGGPPGEHEEAGS